MCWSLPCRGSEPAEAQKPGCTLDPARAVATGGGSGQSRGVSARFAALSPFVRSAILAAVDRAAASLDGPSPLDEERVHDARLELKAARAWLRLWHGPDAEWLRQERRKLSRLARLLGATRDEQVVFATVADLCRRIAAPPPPIGPPTVRLEQAAAEFVRTELQTARQRLLVRPWPPLSEAAMAEALRRSYRRMQRRRAAVEARRLAARAHEWRKSVIVLREQLDLLAPRLPKWARRTHGELVQLARRLGRAGDLRLVEIWLRTKAVADSEMDTAEWLRLARARRRRLVDRALRWSAENKYLAASPRMWMAKLRRPIGAKRPRGG